MYRRFAALLVIITALACVRAAVRAETVSGTWSLERSQTAGKVSFGFHSGGPDGNWQSDHWSDFEIADLHGFALSDLDSDGKAVAFSLSRDAGTFDFTGRVSQGKAFGAFTFTPSASYLEGLRKRGFEQLETRKVMTAASLDISLAYIDSVHAAGFHDIDFGKLITFRALKITPESIAQFRAAFPADTLSANEVVTLTALRINRAYIEELRGLGITDLTEHSVVELKAMRIDRDYVDRLARMGYPHLSSREIVEMKAIGIDEAYLRKLADHGFHDLPVAKLIQLKAAGI